ncbi:MAG: hypothetical protein R3E68_10065 [Burkholderiaceae bacterium]
MSKPARRFELQPFTTAQWPLAQAMLERGFPDDRPTLWRKGLARRLAVPPQSGDDTAGLLLTDGDGPAGMMLSYTSLRPDDDTPRRVTNLSSWFIEPRARFQALAMLRQATADPAVTYTDLSATPAVARMLPLVGFRPIAHQFVIVPALHPTLVRGATPVLASGQAALAQLQGHPLHQAFADHLALGCLLCVVESRQGPQPIVLRPKDKAKLLRGAELIYAASHAVFMQNIGPISRYLLGRGRPFLVFEAPQDAEIPVSSLRLFKRRFAKGPYDERGVDHLYSELAYLQL